MEARGRVRDRQSLAALRRDRFLLPCVGRSDALRLEYSCRYEDRDDRFHHVLQSDLRVAEPVHLTCVTRLSGNAPEARAASG